MPRRRAARPSPHSAAHCAFPAPSPPPCPRCLALQAFLSLAFLSEGLLLVFHLKGPRVEIMVHLILVLQVFATGESMRWAWRAPAPVLAGCTHMRAAVPAIRALSRALHQGRAAWTPSYVACTP